MIRRKKRKQNFRKRRSKAEVAATRERKEDGTFKSIPLPNWVMQPPITCYSGTGVNPKERTDQFSQEARDYLWDRKRRILNHGEILALQTGQPLTRISMLALILHLPPKLRIS